MNIPPAILMAVAETYANAVMSEEIFMANVAVLARL